RRSHGHGHDYSNARLGHAASVTRTRARHTSGIHRLDRQQRAHAGRMVCAWNISKTALQSSTITEPRSVLEVSLFTNSALSYAHGQFDRSTGSPTTRNTTDAATVAMAAIRCAVGLEAKSAARAVIPIKPIIPA